MENEVQEQPIETKEIPSREPLTLKSLASTLRKNKKVVIALLGMLFLVLASILFGVLYSQKLKSAKTAKDEGPKQELYGSLLLTPVNIIGTPGRKSSVDIIINTDARKISGLVIGLKYNPNILENVTIIPYQDRFSALGYSLKQSNDTIIDNVRGEVISTFKLPEGMQDLAGSGKIAEVNFTIKPLKVAVLSTNIEFTTLTGFLSSTRSEHANLTKNQVVITLPPGLKHLSPTPAINK